MRKMVWLCVLLIAVAFTAGGVAEASSVNLYVDAAPNVYGSPDYAAWRDAAFLAAASGSFVNMANSFNPANVGTTEFEIQDEVVYSFGDLGSRLTWIYWIPGETVDSLAGRFDISLENVWDGAYLDFYDDYYGSTWLVPSSWTNYAGGVIGTAGMAWWGAYGVNTQEALDADIAAWIQSWETWTFTARLDGVEYSITSTRDVPVVPVPPAAGIGLLGMGILGFVRRYRRKA